MAKTTLTTLPSEIFEHVAEHLPAKDVKSLRLVSREACSKVLRAYTRMLFTHQAFFINSQESLELVIQIAQHAIFGPAMKKISFLIEGVYVRPGLRKELETAQTSRDAALRGVDCDSSLYNRYTELIETFQRPLRAANKQDLFHVTGSRILLLQNLFTIVIRIGTLQELELTDRASIDIRPVIRSGMECFSHNNKMKVPECRNHQSFELISEAFHHATSKVSTEFILPTFTCQSTSWNLAARRLDQRTQFQQIQNLDLDVCAKGPATQLIDFVQSLQAASETTLKSLKMRVYRCGNTSTRTLMGLILSKTYAKLETSSCTSRSSRMRILLSLRADSRCCGDWICTRWVS